MRFDVDWSNSVVSGTHEIRNLFRDPKMSRRVLVYVHNLELGGTQINAVDLASGVRALGYESLVVGPSDTLPRGPSLLDIGQERGVPVLAIERQPTTVLAARQFAWLAREYETDLVHGYGTWSFRHLHWGPCLIGRRPLVMTVYEMEVAPFVYRGSPLIVGTGYLVDELRDRPGPVVLVSPPVDLERDNSTAVAVSDFLRANSLPEDHTRIVIVSRLDGQQSRPNKSTGVELAVRTVAGLARTDVDLVVVGTGKEAARLQELADGVNDRLGRRACVFTGPLADPRAAYAAADIVIGMGGSAARGLAFGKPLVVAGEFGNFRTFTPGNSSELFRLSFWDEEERQDGLEVLNGLLSELLSSRQLRVSLGAFGAEFAAEHFSLDAMAGRLVGVYEQALAAKALPAWMTDQRFEARWAAAWLARRIKPGSRLAARLSYAPNTREGLPGTRHRLRFDRRSRRSNGE